MATRISSNRPRKQTVTKAPPSGANKTSKAKSTRTSAPKGVGAIDPHTVRQQVVQHWAPTFYQDTDADDAKGDYITRVNYDGDWKGRNNWNNLHTAKADLKPAIYQSVIETKTHYFITYNAFHPRDWDKLNISVPWTDIGTAHENDLEGAMVVIEKDGSKFGKLSMVLTQAHGNLEMYTNDPKISAGDNENLHKGPIALVDGSHPAIFVEARGHGQTVMSPSRLADKSQFPGKGDGIVYKVGAAATLPKNGNDRNVTYQLRSLHDELWARRNQRGDDKIFSDSTFEYEGKQVPDSFRGDDYAEDAANPPWAWFDGDSDPGEFFFRPAETLSKWVSGKKFPAQYVFNPYLAELKKQQG